MTLCDVLVLETNECALNDVCQNNATCVDLIAAFMCDCAPGFAGTFCETGTCIRLYQAQIRQNDIHCLKEGVLKSVESIFVFIGP